MKTKRTIIGLLLVVFIVALVADNGMARTKIDIIRSGQQKEYVLNQGDILKVYYYVPGEIGDSVNYSLALPGCGKYCGRTAPLVVVDIYCAPQRRGPWRWLSTIDDLWRNPFLRFGESIGSGVEFLPKVYRFEIVTYASPLAGGIRGKINVLFKISSETLIDSKRLGPEFYRLFPTNLLKIELEMKKARKKATGESDFTKGLFGAAKTLAERANGIATDLTSEAREMVKSRTERRPFLARTTDAFVRVKILFAAGALAKSAKALAYSAKTEPALAKSAVSLGRFAEAFRRYVNRLPLAEYENSARFNGVSPPAKVLAVAGEQLKRLARAIDALATSASSLADVTKTVSATNRFLKEVVYSAKALAYRSAEVEPELSKSAIVLAESAEAVIKCPKTGVGLAVAMGDLVDAANVLDNKTNKVDPIFFPHIEELVGSVESSAHMARALSPLKGPKRAQYLLGIPGVPPKDKHFVFRPPHRPKRITKAEYEELKKTRQKKALEYQEQKLEEEQEELQRK